MKIFCVGRNYAAHAAELKNEVPAEPVIFMKPPTALLKQGAAFYLPGFSNDVHHELELVLKINRNGKNIQEKFANKYYAEITAGIDFTARDLQQKLKEKGLPWELAKAFDGSAVLGDFMPFSEGEINFHMEKNGNRVQDGSTFMMLFSFNRIVSFLSQYFTLQQGDLIYTGTPAGVAAVKEGDVLKGYLNNKQVFETLVK
jgi:acylpyruvate hydrolase